MRFSTNNPQHISRITDLFQQSLTEAGINWRNTTGTLGAPTITTSEDQDGSITYEVAFNEYGLYLDKGVGGALKDKTNGSPFQFGNKGKGIFRAMSSSPFGPKAIGAIYWYGITPRPWVYRFRDLITQEFTAQVAMDITQEITASVREIKSTSLKITI